MLHFVSSNVFHYPLQKNSNIVASWQIRIIFTSSFDIVVLSVHASLQKREHEYSDCYIRRMCSNRYVLYDHGKRIDQWRCMKRDGVVDVPRASIEPREGPI